MIRLEQNLQIAAVDYLKAACPDLIFYHAANGGYRTPREASLMKAMGVRAGVADLCLVLPGGKAAFIEFKSPKGRLTYEQISFGRRVIAADGNWAECRSIEVLERILKSWGVKTRARAAA